MSTGPSLAVHFGGFLLNECHVTPDMRLSPSHNGNHQRVAKTHEIRGIELLLWLWIITSLPLCYPNLATAIETGADGAEPFVRPVFRNSETV